MSSLNMVPPAISFQIEGNTSPPVSGHHSVNSSESRATSQLPTTPKPMAKPNESTRSLNNTFGYISITSKMTGSTSYPSLNLPTTTPAFGYTGYSLLREQGIPPETRSIPHFGRFQRCLPSAGRSQGPSPAASRSNQ
jgi:hypothetical protein